MSPEISEYPGGYDIFEGEFRSDARLMPCARCGTWTNHRVIYSVVSDGHPTEPDEAYTDVYQIAICHGCGALTFRRELFDSTSFHDENPDTGDPMPHQWFYPPRMFGVQPMAGALDLPDGVQRIYREVVQALTSDLPVLAGSGLKSLVETVCKEQQASGRHLDERIDDLQSKGLITKKQAEVLHGTRILGNKAAHEVRVFAVDDLKAALSVVEHLLNEVYLLHRKGGRLPKRKQ